MKFRDVGRASLTLMMEAAMRADPRSLLLEMSVANIDDVKGELTAFLQQTVAERRFLIAQPVLDLLLKRLLKSIQSDEEGSLVSRRKMTTADLEPNSPPWLTKALNDDQPVFQVVPNDTLIPALIHILEWLAVDQDGGKIVKAAPAVNYIAKLTEAADAYFAKQAEVNSKASSEITAAHGPGVPDEAGREVIMVFRQDPHTGVVRQFEGSDVAPNEQGVVVMFWAKVTGRDALNREGELMKHCAGSYFNAVSAGDLMIYSLRSATNQPSVTVEFNMSRGQTSINQVKGKGNRPPVGTYGPYIKSLLNDLGVAPGGQQGGSDTKSCGLFWNKGAYVTLEEVEPETLATFPKGGSIRYMVLESKKDNDYGYGRRTSLMTTHNLYYVEKDGTIPFTFKLRSSSESDANAGGSVSGFDMLRKEISRYPGYLANLTSFLNEKGFDAAAGDVFKDIGLFYDPRHARFGGVNDLTEEVLAWNNVAKVKRLVKDLYFVDSSDTIFANASLDNSMEIRKLEIVNDCPAVAHIPKILMALLSKWGTDNTNLEPKNKDLLRGWGVIWNTKKETYGPVPSDKIMHESKSGKVAFYNNWFYFYGKDGSLAGSAKVGKTEASQSFRGSLYAAPPFHIVQPSNLHVTGQANRTIVYKLLGELTTKPDAAVEVKDFDNYRSSDDARSAGFFQQGVTLVPLADVEKTVKLAAGFTANSQARQGGLKITLLNAQGEDVGELVADTNYAVERFAVPHRSEFGFPMKQVAETMNSFGLAMTKRNVISNYMLFKGGKFVGMDAQRDAQTIGFVSGRMKLGDDLVLKHDSLKNKGNREGDYRFGYISHGESYSTVVGVDWADSYYNELKYHMTKRLPTDMKRETVIKAVAKFMQFFHDKVEPYLTDEYVGVSAAKIPTD